MCIGVRAPPCDTEELLSSAMEMGADYREGDDQAMETGRAYVVLGSPFTLPQHHSATCESSYHRNTSRDGIAVVVGSLPEPEEKFLCAKKSPRGAAADPSSGDEASTRRRCRFDGATPAVDGSTITPSHPVDLRLFDLPWSQEGEERRPNGAKSTALDEPPMIAVADAQKNTPGEKNPYSSSPSVVASSHDRATYPAPTGSSRVKPHDPLYLRPSASCGGGRKVTFSTVTSEKSAAALPTAADDKSSAAEVVSSRLPSSASPRGRRRVPSSARGRPSCPPSRSPTLRSSASPPARGASRSPGRSRGSAMASSPHGRRSSSVSKGNLDAAPNSRFASPPPPPDLQRSCYEMGGGLSGFVGDNSRVGGAFCGGGSLRRSINVHHEALYTMWSSRQQEPLSNEMDTPAVSSSALEQEEEAKALIRQKAKEQAEEAAATAAADRKAARRVTFDPIVIARDDAAAAIRSLMQRNAELGGDKCRVAHGVEETRKFVERLMEQERGQVRRPAIARPAAQRGAFFGLLSTLNSYKSDWKRFRDFVIMTETFTEFVPLGLTGSQVPVAWGGDGGSGGGGGSACAMAGKRASGASAPPRRVNLGDFVRQTTTNLLT